MKLMRNVVLAVLLLTAALVGWLLPNVVFHLEDRSVEERAQALEISRVDLSYDSELDLASRLELMRTRSLPINSTMLSHGFFLDRSAVLQISRSFLRELTGESYFPSGSWEMAPVLMSFDTGTILVWAVNLNLNGWSWSAIIDDQNGLILQMELQGPPQDWGGLIPELDSVENSQALLMDRLTEALWRHYSQQLDTRVELRLTDAWSEEEACGGTLMILQGEQELGQLPVEAVIIEGHLQVN